MVPEPTIESASVAKLRIAYLELVAALNEVTAPREVHDLVLRTGEWLGIVSRYR